MSTNFPTSLDTSVTIPAEGATIPLSTNHVTTHQNIQDSIEAIEAKVGADSSIVTTSHDYKLSGVTGSDKAVSKTGTETLTNKTLTSPVINVTSDATGDMYYRNAGVLTRIPVGTDNQIMKLNGTTPGWEVETAVVNASTTVAGVVEEATQDELNAGTSTGGTGARLFTSPGTIYNKFKFGGTGADGALTLTSGATNIDLGGTQFVVKNYTSISITGTGSLTFSNQHANGTVIHLKSQGNVTLTSSTAPMIDASGMGATGGAGGNNNSSTAGSHISGTWLLYGGATGRGAAVVSDNAVGGSVPTNNTFYGFGLRAVTLNNERLPVLLVPGAGGSGGSDNAAGDVGGNGGNGGGALYIECGGAWNFTTAGGISVSGDNGVAGSSASKAVGGGGGGGAGTFLALYNTLTANSGTITNVAGTGGAVDAVGAGTPYGGGGGASIGNGGSTGSGGTGGAGGNPISNSTLVLANTSIA
jgi:hypothetical protein